MRYVLTTLLLIPLFATAQHCGYDFASVIVVRPHAVGDSVVVDGLRITLLDSDNLPLVYNSEPYQVFGSNVALESCHGHSYGRWDDRPCCFPFAKDNYILVVPRGLSMAGLNILVQDERTEMMYKRRSQASDRNWPRHFKQQLVPLSEFDTYRLCGVYDEAEYPPMEGRPNFAPVDITLLPR